MISELKFPELPRFTDSLLDECRQDKDFRPIFFEIHKHVGLICNLYACIDKKSSVSIELSDVHFGVLIGLLNRCTRLMLANSVLCCEGKYGETTAILDRCILESALNVRWLCKFRNENSFERFLIYSLKSDIELERNIKQKIDERGGKPLQIEIRMLKSINHCIELTGINRNDFKKFPKLPNFKTRLMQLDFKEDELSYTVIQGMGSHNIHGTWTSLLTHYLEHESDVFHPKDNIVSIHVNQFIVISLEVVQTLKEFVKFITSDEAIIRDNLIDLEKVLNFINTYRLELDYNDFNEVC